MSDAESSAQVICKIPIGGIDRMDETGPTLMVRHVLGEVYLSSDHASRESDAVLPEPSVATSAMLEA